MATRTFGVNTARRDFSQADADADTAAVVMRLDSSNFGPNAYQKAINTATSATKQQLPPSEVAAIGPINRVATDPLSPSTEADEYYSSKTKELGENLSASSKDRESKRNLELLETGLNIINSYNKHSMLETQNNYNILQSKKQLMNVSQTANFAMLRAQSRATSRMEGAQMDAVARGQSSSGDVSAAMQNNEEAALAMDLMNIELNAMYSAMGITQEINQAEADIKISRAYRDMNTISSLSEAGIKLM